MATKSTFFNKIGAPSIDIGSNGNQRSVDLLGQTVAPSFKALAS
jgi:hypothetical protein